MVSDDVSEEEVPAVRRFGWSNMFVEPADDPRSTAPSIGERATLTEYLQAYRQTLELKCQGLDPEQMARRSVPPSDLSLLGLVRHLGDVERNWFRQVLAGEEAPPHFGNEGDWDAAFRDVPPDGAGLQEAWEVWRGEVDFAEHFVESSPDLERTGTMRDGQHITLREVLVHMIEEYARHCGHADLIRERIDGRVGQ
jgi:uncharacterized damage-inducible protein DinB